MTTEANGCRALWLAVLQQALTDVFEGSSAKDGLDRVMAIKFLFDRERYSFWRQQREHICHMAGVDPDAFDGFVRRKAHKLCDKWREWDYELAD